MMHNIMKGIPATIVLVTVVGLIVLAIIEPIKCAITIGSITAFFLIAYLIGKFIQ